MQKDNLNQEFIDKIIALHAKSQSEILTRLGEFEKIKGEQIFYELCYCLCTPQSKAENAFKVQTILEKEKFLYNELNLPELLLEKNNYIRFHNQKAIWINKAKNNFSDITAIIESDKSPQEKRSALKKTVLGFGMKESAHFLRNIGYRGLAILDRHILYCLNQAGELKGVQKLSTEKQYLEIENIYQNFALRLKIDIDELDLTLWSYKAGKILK